MKALKKIEDSAEMMNIGINAKGRENAANALAELLGTSFVLQMKTLAYHWNVTGVNFPALHELFQTQYQALLTANDELAERIRALGFLAPASCKEMTALSEISEDETSPKNANAMIAGLLAGHETASLTARKLCEVAQKNSDEVTADLAIGRITEHDKAAWMLRSMLQ